jgi:hypothetical protein
VGFCTPTPGIAEELRRDVWEKPKGTRTFGNNARGLREGMLVIFLGLLYYECNYSVPKSERRVENKRRVSEPLCYNWH